MMQIQLTGGSSPTPTPSGRLIVLLLIALALSLSKILAQDGSGSSTSSGSTGRLSSAIPCLDNELIRAAVDSAIMYEAVKPINRQLRIITNLQNQENEKLKIALQMQGLQMQTERKERQAEVGQARRKGFWRGAKAGVIAPSLVYLVLLTL
ncbi:MAG: hypothetical protein E6R03_10925 [Hyphomicrobiaceae bacterium]|nr:MAG: hypothetical protein E6R03_10925 [Hyphomicrobiaceae bacterium]